LRSWAGGDTRAWRLLAFGVALVAVAARLTPVVRGGGLWGLGNYDDGVYYAAGTALAHGLVPYRDFLLLHPPGIVLALAPFGMLGRLAGDPSGFAAARLAWISLGGVNAVLVARAVKPLGLVAAASGALLYALAFPAIYIEHTTLLEGPAQTCVLSAIVLLTSPAARRIPAAPALTAGALLGTSATFKIWGVAAVVVVVAWFVVNRAARTSLQVLAGSAVAVTLVCLPFFVLAPTAMWRMVVLDQLNRGEAGAPAAARLAGILGLGLHRPVIQTFTPELVGVLVAVAVVLLLACTEPAVRLAVVLAASLAALLLLSPSWFLHYPGLASGPLAIALAGGGAAVGRGAGHLRRYAGVGLGLVLVCVVVAQIYSLTGLELGRRFPGTSLARSVGSSGGCVTADDPAALIEMNVLSRDLDRGCTFVADLGGYSYELAYRRGQEMPRRSDAAWQRIYLDYLRTGSVALAFRYREGDALSSETLATLGQWAPLSQAGPYRLSRVQQAR
jgi:hypothetical protein